MRLARIALSVLAAFGCASEPKNTLQPGHEGAPGVKRFLVCAPNTVIALPGELQETTKTLREQVDAYLKFHDRETQWIDLYDSKRLWNEAMSSAKQKATLDKTPEFFARTLDELYDFDAIVMPSILLHKVEGNMGAASFDGVERRMRVLNRPRQDERSGGPFFTGLSGELLATSVHVMVFSRGGQRIFEGRGGVELIHEVDMAQFKKKRTLDVRLRSDLGRDIDALREGIAIAFDPYLTRPPEE